MPIEVLGVDAALKALDKYSVKPMEKDTRRATMAGARVAAKLIRVEAPIGATRNLVRSVKARRGRRGYAASLAGPRAPHRHLVILGHRIVTPGGRYTGRRSTPDPFVDRAVNMGYPLIVAAVEKELYK